jgi:hypothetical protein
MYNVAKSRIDKGNKAQKRSIDIVTKQLTGKVSHACKLVVSSKAKRKKGIT